MNQNHTFEKLRTFLDNYIDQSYDGGITVFPLRCGVGKSTYINYRISDYLRHKISDTIRNKPDGLIVITDSIDRMKEYLHDDDKSSEQDHNMKSAEDVFTEFLLRNKDNIAFITKDTATDELKTQRRKQILMLTTQRFFNLSREEIIAFTKYTGGKRNKIIFDEKPFLIEHRQFDIKSFNDIDSALHLTIDDSVDFEEKIWIIEQWENFKKKIQSVMSDYEQQNTSQLEVWHQEENATVTEDDERFFAFIDKYRQKLNQFKPQTYSNIYAVKQLVTEGATFISQKIRSGNEYRNYFIVTLDNSEKLLDLGADVFVLDGTSDIDPIYRQHYVRMIDCSEFNVPLDNLTINIVDIPTSKNQIGKSAARHHAIVSFIKDYLRTDPQKPDVIFTYKEIKDCFEGVFENVHYFGAIKGLNKFRDSTSIAQIGLNRFPDSIYRQITYFTKLNEYDCRNKTVVRVIGKRAAENTMNHLLLVDFEQNMFRSKIRNIGCSDSVTYTIFFNCDVYGGLIELIKERYGSLGATINVIPTPAEFKMQKSLDRNTSSKTNVQTFLEWYNRQPEGRLFRRSDVLQECNFTGEQFKNLKKSAAIKQIFNDAKTDVDRIYKVHK